jgi:hypothetical protein
MIEPGKHVKYFLRNGMVLEGICEKDGGSEVVLQSLDGKSLMILHKPAEDIMMTKVVLVEETDEPAPAPVPQEEYEEPQPTDNGDFHTRATAKLREIQQAEGNVELTEKSIAELREMVRDQDRQILASQRKEHFGNPGNAKMTEYSSPLTPMRTVGRRIVPRSAYQPGTIPNWAYGRPPAKGK